MDFYNNNISKNDLKKIFNAWLQEENKNDKKYNYWDFADEIISHYTFIKVNDTYYSYKDNHYQIITENDIKNLIYNYFKGKYLKTKNQRNEVFDCIMRDNGLEAKSEPYLISFNNGILDINTIEISEDRHPKIPLKKHKKDRICTVHIPYDLKEPRNPSSYSPIDKAIKAWTNNDKEIETLLYEMFGYIFVPNTEMQKAFWLTGKGGNGKSTFIDFLEKIIPDELRTSLTLSQIGEKFSGQMLEGKLVNLCGDLSDKHMNSASSSVFKKIVTGDSIKVERKNKDPKIIKPTCKLIIGCNNLPTNSSSANDIFRRLIIVPFLNDFTGKNNIPDLLNTITTPACIEYFIYMSIVAYAKARNRGYFTHPEACKKIEDEYKRKCNSVLRWVYDENIDFSKPEKTAVEYFDNYCCYCSVNKYHAVGKDKFKDTLKMHLNAEYGVQKRIQDGRSVKTIYTPAPVQLTIDDIENKEAD